VSLIDFRKLLNFLFVASLFWNTSYNSQLQLRAELRF